MKTKLTDVARVIRSKNAGPFELTLDIIFQSPEIYNQVKRTKMMDEILISRLYGVDKESVKKVIFFDPAHAVKITMKRPIPSGEPGDSDIYGAQQHAPLLDVELDLAGL